MGQTMQEHSNQQVFFCLLGCVAYCAAGMTTRWNLLTRGKGWYRDLLAVQATALERLLDHMRHYLVSW
jgi:hypothetical protein